MKDMQKKLKEIEKSLTEILDSMAGDKSPAIQNALSKLADVDIEIRKAVSVLLIAPVRKDSPEDFANLPRGKYIPVRNVIQHHAHAGLRFRVLSAVFVAEQPDFSLIPSWR